MLEMQGVLASGVLENLTDRVKVEMIGNSNNLPVITCAARLAHHGYLGSVNRMTLSNINLTSVPAEHLASLASSATGWVDIHNVSGCDLVTILDSVKSDRLIILKQSLGNDETRALVRAMESRVEKVMLDGMVTLDIGSLMDYSGQGKCVMVTFYEDTEDIYKEQLKALATSINWAVTNAKGCICIKRI